MVNFIKNLCFFLLPFIFLAIASCGSTEPNLPRGDDVNNDDNTKLIKFRFEAHTNPSSLITKDLYANIYHTNNTIIFPNIESNFNLSELKIVSFKTYLDNNVKVSIVDGNHETLQKSGVTINQFSQDLTYRVTFTDRNGDSRSKDYTVVKLSSSSNNAAVSPYSVEVESFKFEKDKNPNANIPYDLYAYIVNDYDTGSIIFPTLAGDDFENLKLECLNKLTFTLSKGAKLKKGTTEIISGTALPNLTKNNEVCDPETIKPGVKIPESLFEVEAEDGTIKKYTLKALTKSYSDNTDLTNIRFTPEKNPGAGLTQDLIAAIDADTGEVSFTKLARNINPYKLKILSFTSDSWASVTVAGKKQKTGVNSHEFYKEGKGIEITYSVQAENPALAPKIYTIKALTKSYSDNTDLTNIRFTPEKNPGAGLTQDLIAAIDADTGEVSFTKLARNINPYKLKILSFTSHSWASVTVAGKKQKTGVNSHEFYKEGKGIEITYSVQAENLALAPKIYTIKALTKSYSDNTDLTNIRFTPEKNPGAGLTQDLIAAIDADTGEVSFTKLARNINPYKLKILSFTSDSWASVTVAGKKQKTGVNSHEFYKEGKGIEITYSVQAENPALAPKIYTLKALTKSYSYNTDLTNIRFTPEKNPGAGLTQDLIAAIDADTGEVSFTKLVRNINPYKLKILSFTSDPWASVTVAGKKQKTGVNSHEFYKEGKGIEITYSVQAENPALAPKIYTIKALTSELSYKNELAELKLINNENTNYQGEMVTNRNSSLNNVIYFSKVKTDSQPTYTFDKVVVQIQYFRKTTFKVSKNTKVYLNTNLIQKLSSGTDENFDSYEIDTNFSESDQTLKILSEDLMQENSYTIKRITKNKTLPSDPNSMSSYWMAYLDNSKKLNRISIPGTHDTAAYQSQTIIGDHRWKTQDHTVEWQLENGVRFLDVRIKYNENSNRDHFSIHHGSVNLNQELEVFLKKVYSFLKANPSEFVIMSIKQEDSSFSDSDLNSLLTKYLFTDEYVTDNSANNYSALWYQSDNQAHQISVSDVRGKIVLLKRCGCFSWGINASIPDMATDSTSGDIRVQDYYKVDVDDDMYATKVKYVKDLLNAAKTDTNSNYLYLNFMSGYQNGSYWIPFVGEVSTGIPNIHKVATIVLPSINSYFDAAQNAKGRYGVVIMDMILQNESYYQNFIRKVYNSNF